MSKVNYNSCPLNNHDDELMNLVCIDTQCQNRGLICAVCTQHHSQHKIIPLKNFLFEYKEQSKKWIIEQNQSHCIQLTQQIEQMIITLQDSRKIIQENFNESINKLEQTKVIVKSFGKNQKQEQQLQILNSIEKSEVMQKDLAQLLESVESFVPSQEFIFHLKQENQTLDSIDQRIKNAKQTAQQQQSFMNTITETIAKSNETLTTQLESLFKDTNHHQSSLEETNQFNQFKSNQKFTNVQPHVKEINGKEKSQIPLEIQKLALQAQPQTKQQQQQQQQQSQFLQPQPQPLPQSKPQPQPQPQQQQQQKQLQKLPPQPTDVKNIIEVLSDNEHPKSLKPISPLETQAYFKNKQQTKSKGDQGKQKQSEQLIKQNHDLTLSQLLNQPQTTTNSRPCPQQLIQDELLNKELQELSDDNEQESQNQEYELNIQRKDPKQVCQTPIMKILLTDNDTHLIVLTHTGKIIQYNYQTNQIITQQDNNNCAISDGAYSILHNQLYLACKTGKLNIYTRDINKLDQPLIQNYSQTADKIALLLIQEHEVEKHVFTIGEERILKSFSARSGREVARYDGFNDYPRVLLFDKERNQIFLGGNKIVMVFDQKSKTIKKTIDIDQKITNIQIDGNEIVLILESKIIYVNSTNFAKTNEITVNNSIVCSALYHEWHMIIVCVNQSEPQLQIYSIQQGFVENIGPEDSTIICIKELKEVTYVFIGERSGQLVKYCVAPNSGF